MYTSFHTAVGGGLTVASPFIASSMEIDANHVLVAMTIIATVSHMPIDYLGEPRYETISGTLILEFVLIMAMFYVTYFLNYDLFWYFVIGIIASNFIDVVDKSIYFILNKNPVFQCHQKGWDFIKLSESTTLICNFGATLAYCLIVPFLAV